jgi:hypothetical protein
VNGSRRPKSTAPQAGSASGPSLRSGRCPVIRVTSLDTAERFFVEHGTSTLAGRRFRDGPSPALTPHRFSTDADLARAVTRRFTVDVEAARAALIADLDDTAGIRDWIGCLVHPWIDHLAQQETTYFARFCAQVMTDSTLRAAVTEEAVLSPTLRHTREALARCLPAMSDEVAVLRGEVVQQLIIRMCAEREGALAAGLPTVWPTWRGLADGLVDALTGIWTAPCTTASHAAEPGKRA